MNERIRQLAEQADGVVINKMMTGARQYTFLEEDLEKFAELIVRECVQTLIDKTPVRYINELAEEDWDKGYDRAMKDCVHYIQEHFGVEE